MPFPTQIEWLRKKFLTPTDATSGVDRSASPCSGHYLLLIKRTKSRQIKQEGKIRQSLSAFAKQHSMQLKYHDDRRLPSLTEQIALFAASSIVVAPHGAGLLFMTFMPPNSCVIEFVRMPNPECYARIAYIR